VRDVPEVYIVKDDGPATRTLTLLLTAAGFLSRSFENASGFLGACDRMPAGCVITSLQTGDVGAIEFLHRLSAEPVAFPAIIIASGGDLLQAVEAMKAGAATVLERPYSDELLLDAVRSALEVEVRAATQTAQRTALATLTAREHGVLRGLLVGKTNRMIAADLSISARTVEVHRARVMRKAGVSSIAALVRLADSAERSH
jgi:two-component system response regulator FixJ